MFASSRHDSWFTPIFAPIPMAGCRTTLGSLARRMRLKRLVRIMIRGITLGSPARSRNARVFTAVKCPNNCWRGLFVLPVILTIWFWIRLEAVGQRFALQKSFTEIGSELSCRKTTQSTSRNDWIRRSQVQRLMALKIRSRVLRKPCEVKYDPRRTLTTTRSTPLSNHTKPPVKDFQPITSCVTKRLISGSSMPVLKRALEVERRFGIG